MFKPIIYYLSNGRVYCIDTSKLYTRCFINMAHEYKVAVRDLFMLMWNVIFRTIRIVLLFYCQRKGFVIASQIAEC